MLTDEAPDCDGQGQGQTIRANRRLSEVLATRRAGAQGRRVVVVVVVDVEKKTRKKPTTVPNGPIGRSVPTFFCSAVIGRRKRSHSRSANEGRPLGFGEAWRPTDPPIGGGVASQIRGPDCGQSQSPIRTHVPFPDNNINNNNNNNNNNNLAGFVSSMLRLSESPIASLFIGRPRGRSSGDLVSRDLLRTMAVSNDGMSRVEKMKKKTKQMKLRCTPRTRRCRCSRRWRPTTWNTWPTRASAGASGTPSKPLASTSNNSNNNNNNNNRLDSPFVPFRCEKRFLFRSKIATADYTE